MKFVYMYLTSQLQAKNGVHHLLTIAYIFLKDKFLMRY